MPRSHQTIGLLVLPIVAGLKLAAATDSSFAAASTGARPTTSGAGQAFGVRPTATKGVGAESGMEMGGAAGIPAAPPARRPHHPWPTAPRD